MKRIVIIFCAFLLIWYGLFQFNKTERPPLAQSDTEISELYDTRTSYLGDNSAIGQVLLKTNVGAYGDYTYELKTDERPYVITVHFKQLSRPFAKIDFDRSAILILALVDNADEVEFRYGEERYALTRKGASRIAGKDVSDIGASKEALEDFLSKDHP